MFFELDYDWKNADTRRASGVVEFTEEVTDEEAEQLLLSENDEFDNEFSSQYVSFIPDTVNGEGIIDLGGSSLTLIVNWKDPRWPKPPFNPLRSGPHLSWVTAACLACLRSRPGTRKFVLEGVIE